MLTDGEGNVLQTTRNDKNGDFTFDEVIFTQDDLGEHLYRVYEIDEKDENFVYDASVYSLTVTVGDNGDGTLSAAVSIQKTKDEATDDVAKIAFVNEYIEPEVPPTPQTDDMASSMWYLLALSVITFFGFAVRHKRAKSF